MDLELLEALALADDRPAAISRLVAGSEDHDYYRALALQHAGALDEVDAVLLAWPTRHGHGERLQRLRRRQLLLRAGAGTVTDAVADDLRDAAGANLWHEADRASLGQRHPTHLDPALVDADAVVADAVRREPSLALLSSHALDAALDRSLDAVQRRHLLSRLERSRQPRLVEVIAADLVDPGSRGFGSLRIHGQLTLDQLRALGERLPALHQHGAWVDAVVIRLRPPQHVDWRGDLDARAAYLDRLWSFVATLPPLFNGLRVHVLHHRLDLDRRRGHHDRDRFLLYLALPRRVPYARPDWLRTVGKDEVAMLGQGFVTGLEPVAADVDLVRDYLHHFLVDDDGSAFAPFLEAGWLATERAIVGLTRGHGDPARWVAQLGPEALAALEARVDIDLAPSNPVRLAADQPVVLEVDVKNVPALTIKVFRIDTLAWFLASGSEVDAAIDLDGLTAGTERVLTSTAPPIRRHRERVELAACARPGTYVVELIGNGRSSRALLHKGSLRHVVRVSAAGPILTVCDDGGRPLPDAAVWLGGVEYRSRDDGGIALPFSTRPGPLPILLVHGELGVRAVLDAPAETYQLAADVHLERESLVAGTTARAVIRVRLTVAGVATTVAVLDQPRVTITLTDVTGVVTSSDQALDLGDDRDAIVEWQVPAQVVEVGIRVRARVRSLSEQRTIDLDHGITAAVAGIERSEQVEALHLAPSPDGWLLSLLGKSGEPRPRRALALRLQPRAVTFAIDTAVETDDSGRAWLGALDGIDDLEATAPSGVSRRWRLPEPAPALPVAVHVVEGDDIVLPASVGAPPMLTEIRGGAAAHDASGHLRPGDLTLVVSGLGAGSYQLTGPALPHPVSIEVVARTAPIVAGWATTGSERIELTAPPPVLRDIASDGGHIVIEIASPSPTTRVHVIASHFLSAPVTGRGLLSPPPPPRRHPHQPPLSSYLSGRELGDEYRYVLDRRTAPRRAGTLLDRPGLLLNPWSVRTTTTRVESLARGGAYAGSARPGAPPPPPAPIAVAVAGDDDRAFAGHDFLAEAAVVIGNLRPDGRGLIRVDASALGGAAVVRVVCVDPALVSSARRALTSAPPPVRDRSLRLALPAHGHFTEDRQVTGLATGGSVTIADLATARVRVVDTVAQVHGYLLGLSGDDQLRRFAFVTRWHLLSMSEKRTLYSDHACHELHLLLWARDPGFFAEVVRPYLAHKRGKTFLDHWLLDHDLTRYLEPWAFGRLNALERALLGRRVPAIRDAVARLAGDAVDIAPRDPEGDAARFDRLIAGGALDGDDRLGIAAATRDATAAAEALAVAPQAMLDTFAEQAEAAEPTPARGRARKRADQPTAIMAALPASAGPPAEPMAAGFAAFGGGMAGAAPGAGAGFDPRTVAADLASRQASAPLYRGADRTQEWAESDWWRRPVADAGPELIPVNRFWRDFAGHGDGPFLSAHIADCAGSTADALCALAVLGVPFAAGQHRVEVVDGAMTITAASPCLVAHSQIAPIAGPERPGPIQVGQSYLRSDDRWQWDGGEQHEKYATGELLTGVVYACRVVVSNPTPTRHKLDVLVQIPRGAIAVAGGVATRTVHADVEPYGTWSIEHAFYMPTAGRHPHFPAHVSRGGELVAWAEPGELVVVDAPSQVDAGSWPHLALHGDLDQVVAFLDGANLARLDLDRIGWRLRDRTAFDRITQALARRLVYSDPVWAYALVHRDRTRLAEWLHHQDGIARDAGAVVSGPLVIDAVARGWYQHLEYAPLVNARAHAVGGRARIRNDGLDRQYRAFLDLVAAQPRASADDLLAAAHYLFAQDRVDEAAAALARVDRGQVASALQHDYLRAYAATLSGDLAGARALAAPWADHPVDRWRHRFAALLAMLDEAEGGATAAAGDPDSRDQRLAELAAAQPSLAVGVDGGDIVVDAHHLARCELRFHRMDIELLFSRQPFVQRDTRRFSFVEPTARLELALAPGRTRVGFPAALAGANVVIEVVAPGLRAAVAHYAHDLAVQLAHGYGQIRVARASTGAGLAATYVKVYVRHRGGAVHFYKDGYTDLRGRFDYATLSTDDLDRVERFALLVVSDDAGATVIEAEPPPR